jgi:hypothetical protein
MTGLHARACMEVRTRVHAEMREPAQIHTLTQTLNRLSFVALSYKNAAGRQRTPEKNQGC